jgi:hypothetical protein
MKIIGMRGLFILSRGSGAEQSGGGGGWRGGAVCKELSLQQLLEHECPTPLAERRREARGDLLGPDPERFDGDGREGNFPSVGERGRKRADRPEDEGDPGKIRTGILKLGPDFRKEVGQLPFPERRGTGDNKLLVEEGGRVRHPGDRISEDLPPLPVEGDESRLSFPAQGSGNLACNRLHRVEGRTIIGKVHGYCLMDNKEGFATFLTPVA